MSPYLILVTILFYFIIMYAISFVSGNKSSNATFFVGNRQSKWWVVAFAMIGSSISGVTYVSVPGMVAESGFSYLQMVMGFVVGQFLIAFVLVPMFYKMKLYSIYEYLNQRFGLSSYRTGAWFFFISKMLGAGVRLFLVVLILQMLIFDPLDVPFWINVLITMSFIWLYTLRGGVKTLIWTDLFKTFCLVVSVVLTIYFITRDLNLSNSLFISSLAEHDYSRVFFFDDINDNHYFFKYFFAGIFTVIAMNGLDQDMMQRNLSCRNYRDSQKNMIVSSILQFVIVSLFLILGVTLYFYAEQNQISIPENGDKLFPMLATQGYLPKVVGFLFIIGLVSSAYSAAGSALTALTTSFTIDIIGTEGKSESQIGQLRKKVHFLMALALGLVVIIFNILNNTSVINAVYTLASYTYGPILGLFVFGFFSKRRVKDRFVPYVALISPLLCYVLQTNSKEWFNGYSFSYELLIFNAAFTILGLYLFSTKKRPISFNINR